MSSLLYYFPTYDFFSLSSLMKTKVRTDMIHNMIQNLKLQDAWTD